MSDDNVAELAARQYELPAIDISCSYMTYFKVAIAVHFTTISFSLVIVLSLPNQIKSNVSIFIDFQLVILGITRFTDSDESYARFYVQYSVFWPSVLQGEIQTLSFFCPQFSSGSNYSSQNAGTIANKFQLYTYFRFR